MQNELKRVLPTKKIIMENQKINSNRTSIAVIVGGCSEDGLFAANNLLDTYDKVLLVDSDWNVLKAAVEKINAFNNQDKLIPIKADLDSSRDVAKLACLIHYRYGGTELLISYESDNSGKHVNLQNALQELQNA